MGVRRAASGVCRAPGSACPCRRCGQSGLAGGRRPSESSATRSGRAQSHSAPPITHGSRGPLSRRQRKTPMHTSHRSLWRHREERRGRLVGRLLQQSKKRRPGPVFGGVLGAWLVQTPAVQRLL